MIAISNHSLESHCPIRIKQIKQTTNGTLRMIINDSSYSFTRIRVVGTVIFKSDHKCTIDDGTGCINISFGNLKTPKRLLEDLKPGTDGVFLGSIVSNHEISCQSFRTLPDPLEYLSHVLECCKFPAKLSKLEAASFNWINEMNVNGKDVESDFNFYHIVNGTADQFVKSETIQQGKDEFDDLFDEFDDDVLAVLDN